MVSENYTPLVSIVIPAYNASNYLAEAIDSALAQTYPNVEIIVVNDGSRDNGATERIALSYGEKIRYFSKENGGSSSALNVGIANMTGEWFSWLSHDDLYVPQKLEKQVAYMNSLRITAAELPRHIFFSAWDLIDGDGKTFRKADPKQEAVRAEKIRTMPHNGYLIAEPTNHIYHGCSCLIHRDAFSDVGCLDEKLRIVNDLDLWFRLYAAGYHVHFIPEALVKGRVHGAQVSKTVGYSYHNSEQDMYWNRSLNWLLENYPEDQRLFYLFARNAYLKTRYAEGDRAFANIRSGRIRKAALKAIYRNSAIARNFAKNIYLKLKT